MAHASDQDPDLRYCATAVIDLLGFSAHLEVGSNDVRTTIGSEAIKRLEVLEEAVRLFRAELLVAPIAYPRTLSYRRINDALILSVDLSDMIAPSVGEAMTRGVTVGDLERYFDMDAYRTQEDGSERFAEDFRGRLNADVGDLINFLGLTARIHEFVNAMERARILPGAKTICATGFRRRFRDHDGQEDPLAANFSFANAFVADRSLHGARLFVDDTIARLICVDEHALNLTKYACLVAREKEFDPADEHRSEFYIDTERVLSEPQRVDLFRKSYVFREMTATPLTYLQYVRPLSAYLSRLKKPAESCPPFVCGMLDAIGTRPDLNAVMTGKAQMPRLLRNDISSDIRILQELIESGASRTAREQDFRGVTITAPAKL